MHLGEDFKAFLPKYLSESEIRNLFMELRQFPENIDGRMYTAHSQLELLQGDVLDALPFIKFPDQHIGEKRAILLSNTCDVAVDNRRYTAARAVYAPVISLDKWRTVVERSGLLNPAQLDSYVGTVRQQLVTSLFYLPQGQGLNDEGVALLDCICNCDATHVLDLVAKSPEKRVSLSNYGFYLFLFKLSVHFCRIQEKVNRS